MLSTAFDVFIPVLSGKIVDAFTLPVEVGGKDVIDAISLFLLAVFLVYTTRWIAFQFYNTYECYSMRDVLKDALHKVQNFSTVWHSNNFSGGTVRKITRARTAFYQSYPCADYHVWRHGNAISGFAKCRIVHSCAISCLCGI